MRKYSNQRLAANLFQHRSGVVPKYAEEEEVEEEEEEEEKWNPIQPAGGRADVPFQLFHTQSLRYLQLYQGGLITLTAIRTLTLRMTSKVTEVFGLNLFQHFHKPFLFLSDPGVPGVRSMGPDVSN